MKVQVIAMWLLLCCCQTMVVNAIEVGREYSI
jgi:hypothetical protein